MIQFMMLIVTWAATLGIFHLLYPLFPTTARLANWNAPLYLTVGSILFAEALLFSRGLLRRAAPFGSAASEADSGLTMVNGIYALIVAVLAVVKFAAAPSMKTLAILHIVAGLFLVLGWGIAAKTRNFLQRQEDAANRT